MKHDNYSSGLWHECDDQILGDDGLVIFRATENPLVKNQHRANVQRAVACVNAFDGIETGRLAGKGLGEFLAGEVRLNKAESQPDGSFGFTFSGFAVQIMAESFADQFRESGAVNYLELLFEHKEIGPLTVTMQRTQGLTPAQKLAKAEAERDELVRQVSELQLSQQNIINAFGISGEGAHSKLVIEYVHGLVAENVAVKKYAKIDDYDKCDNCGFESYVMPIETPNTDSFTAELRAQGVDEFAEYIVSSNRTVQNLYCEMQAISYAHDMRKRATDKEIMEVIDSMGGSGNKAARRAANLRAGRKG